MKYILALDQGTTSSRAIVFDKLGNIVSVKQQEYEQIYPKTAWVEHDPNEILASQLSVITQALVKASINASDLAAIGITNQRETTIVWNKETGKVLYNAIVWQCRRTSDYCKELKKAGYDKIIYEKTGLILDPYFSATKIKWILDNVSGARELANQGKLCFGTVDTYLMWNLSDKNNRIFKTDYTNASRTMLFNIHTLDWDDELLELFDIPRSMLASVHPSSYDFGYASEAILGAKVPITGVSGDQQAALFGQLCTEKGSCKNTYGTGCFLLMNTGDVCVKSKHGLITTLAASIDEKPNFVLEGSVFVGGAVVKWLRDELKMIEKASETEKIASSLDSNGGLYIVPAFVGLGAPHWNSNVRGMALGITRGTKKEHFVRASLESIAYQVLDMINAMENDLGEKISELSVDGGACINNFLMQFQADILNSSVLRPKNIEVTAMGAAFLAGLRIKYYESIESLKQNKQIEKKFEPNMDETQRINLINGWNEALNVLLKK